MAWSLVEIGVTIGILVFGYLLARNIPGEIQKITKAWYDFKIGNKQARKEYEENVKNLEKEKDEIKSEVKL